jgi:dTDP-4-amino-4,6-dideoxygalactose transaminase
VTVSYRTVPFLDLGSMTRDVATELDHAWREMLKTSAFIGGPNLARFEGEWAAYCGTTEAVGVANGTDAIELTLRALGVGPGDEVILPTNTFVATAEAVVFAGATPHFVDVDPNSLLMTPEAAFDAINPRTAAIIAVHLYGNMGQIDAIAAMAQRHGLALIEDAAQAHGAGADSRAGSIGTAGCFSFYPGKNLGAFGDAGAVVTNNKYLAEHIRTLGDHGRTSHTSHDLVGKNSRLDGLQAAVLSCKLPMLDHWNAARRAAVAKYRGLLDPGLVRLVEHDATGVCHLNVALVPNRDRVREELLRRGIHTAVHYPVPCHLQRPYADYPRGDVTVAEVTASQLLSLPLFPHITDADIEYVCRALSEVVQEQAA